MEVRISPEKEDLLKQLATRTGKTPAQLVEEAVDRLLDYDAWFIAQVEEGLAEAARGQLLEHEEVVERIEKRLRPKQHSY